MQHPATAHSINATAMVGIIGTRFRQSPTPLQAYRTRHLPSTKNVILIQTLRSIATCCVSVLRRTCPGRRQQSAFEDAAYNEATGCFGDFLALSDSAAILFFILGCDVMYHPARAARHSHKMMLSSPMRVMGAGW